MFYMHNLGWGWWLLMSIGMLAFWGLVIYGIVALTRGGWTRGSEPPPSPEVQETPKDILDRRLAAGEITVEEHHYRLAAVEGKQPLCTPS